MSLRSMFLRTIPVAAVAIAAAVQPSSAQTYPSKSIRFVVPYSPGGPTDLVARLLGQRMSQSWGQPVVVENRAGANGNIAAEYVSRAPGDGAFGPRYDLPPGVGHRLLGKRLALVDDVMSAGSSLRATLTAVEQHGAIPVVAGTLAVLGATGENFFKQRGRWSRGAGRAP